MKVKQHDRQYYKVDNYTRKVIDRAVGKLCDRLQYYLDQGKRIDNIFGDDILIHDIFAKNLYVYKCYINGMQMRLLYTVNGKTLVIVAHYIKKDKPQEWLSYFEKVGREYSKRYAPSSVCA